MEGSEMKTTQVRTLCECQACLVAEIDEHLNVISGSCEDSRKRKTVAPASKTFVSGQQVGISFSCPACTRNVLRTFSLAKLLWVVPRPMSLVNPANVPSGSA